VFRGVGTESWNTGMGDGTSEKKKKKKKKKVVLRSSIISGTSTVNPPNMVNNERE
jgi:hypothetical protein